MTERDHAFYAKNVDGGRRIEVIPLTFGRARLCIGRRHDVGYDDGW